MALTFWTWRQQVRYFILIVADIYHSPNPQGVRRRLPRLILDQSL
jgi:hypothetical protein